VAVGDAAGQIAAGARSAAGSQSADGHVLDPAVQTVPDVDAAYALLAENLRPGDVVLIKSSNATGLRWLGDRVAGSGTGRQDVS
ncbi:MAG: hypothetical protein WAR57_09880, partial [Candidatus Phosphoribacter sp.]